MGRRPASFLMGRRPASFLMGRRPGGGLQAHRAMSLRGRHPPAGIARARTLQASKGVGSVCITDTGAMGGRLLGIVTTRDVDFVSDRMTPLAEIMTKWVARPPQRALLHAAGGAATQMQQPTRAWWCAARPSPPPPPHPSGAPPPHPPLPTAPHPPGTW
jgi:CBS domain-containing protein